MVSIFEKGRNFSKSVTITLNVRKARLRSCETKYYPVDERAWKFPRGIRVLFIYLASKEKERERRDGSVARARLIILYRTDVSTRQTCNRAIHQRCRHSRKLTWKARSRLLHTIFIMSRSAASPRYTRRNTSWPISLPTNDCRLVATPSIDRRRFRDLDTVNDLSSSLSLSLSLSVSRRAPWYPVCNRLRRLIDYRIARCRISGASFSCVDLISIFVLIRMWNVKLAFSW